MEMEVRSETSDGGLLVEYVFMGAESELNFFYGAVKEYEAEFIQFRHVGLTDRTVVKELCQIPDPKIKRKKINSFSIIVNARDSAYRALAECASRCFLPRYDFLFFRDTAQEAIQKMNTDKKIMLEEWEKEEMEKTEKETAGGGNNGGNAKKEQTERNNEKEKKNVL